MEAINVKVANNQVELEQLKHQAGRDCLKITQDFLVLEAMMIYFNTLTSSLNGEIKSTQVKNYLMLARKIFDDNFSLLKHKKLTLKVMEPNKNRNFKKALRNENDFIQTLVRNLNKIFIVQYDKYSWKTFNDFYVINEDKIKTISKNVESVIKQAKLIKFRIGHLASFDLKEKPDLTSYAFLPLEEKNNVMLPLMLHLTTKK